MTDEKNITFEPIKTTLMKITLIGDTDLILNKKARSYELEEVFKQSHQKGTKIPQKYQQPYNVWEKLITSINWIDPIVYHDDDNSLYTEEEWKFYMQTNKPFIFGKAFKDSWSEAFKSCGFKDSTGKAGTDFERSVIVKQKNIVTFAEASYDQHLAMTKGLSRTNVLTQNNLFTGWKVGIEITFIESIFPKETLIDLIHTSGIFIGIGSRRKEGYGRYHIGEVVIQ